MLEADEKYGKFEFRPLEPGYGITIGNPLRRILLSSLEGYAINTIRIAGVEHEFSTIPGVKEDVTNIILNLKQVRFKQVADGFESEKVSISIENSTEFKAGDINKYLSGFGEGQGVHFIVTELLTLIVVALDEVSDLLSGQIIVIEEELGVNEVCTGQVCKKHTKSNWN